MDRRGAGLRRGIRKRGVIGSDHLLAGVGLACAAHEEPDRQVLGALDEVPEGDPRVRHRLMAGEQPRVEHDDPCDPVGVLDRQPKSHRAAPSSVSGEGR